MTAAAYENSTGRRAPELRLPFASTSSKSSRVWPGTPRHTSLFFEYRPVATLKVG
jgi:hypothetical protein